MLEAWKEKSYGPFVEQGAVYDKRERIFSVGILHGLVTVCRNACLHIKRRDDPQI